MTYLDNCRLLRQLQTVSECSDNFRHLKIMADMFDPVFLDTTDIRKGRGKNSHLCVATSPFTYIYLQPKATLLIYSSLIPTKQSSRAVFE